MREFIRKILREEFSIINEGLYEDGEGVYTPSSVRYYEPNSSYYFNDLKFIRKHNPDEESYITYGDGEEEFHSPVVSIIFNGNQYDIPIMDSKGKVIFDSYTKDGKLTAKIRKSNMLKLYPNFTLKNPKEYNIDGPFMRKVLEKAFPNNWVKGDKEFSSGIRGIYTLGEKMGTKESWSIMNWFDTKKEIHKIILDKYLSENTTTPIGEWLINKLRTDKKFVNELVDRQWQSIKSGVETEQKALDTFKKVFKGDYITYPPGHQMDRYRGVDVTLPNGKNLQIKPLKSFNKKTLTVGTYNMRDYSEKFPNLYYLVFINDTDIVIFENKNYTIERGNNVVFTENPISIDDMVK